MRFGPRQIAALSTALALILPQLSYAQSPPTPSDSPKSSQQGSFTMKVNAELVLTNVIARDAKTHELVLGLKQSDFTVYENGKQQQIATFDFQSVDMATPLNEATISGLAVGAQGPGSKA